jgi:hypothetical protein
MLRGVLSALGRRCSRTYLDGLADEVAGDDNVPEHRLRRPDE